MIQHSTVFQIYKQLDSSTSIMGRNPNILAAIILTTWLTPSLLVQYLGTHKHD